MVDHIVPVTRNGTNQLSNLATTSAVNNVAKGTALLSELSWTLLSEPSSSESWDGMTAWFTRALAAHPALLDHATLSGWAQALRKNAA